MVGTRWDIYDTMFIYSTNPRVLQIMIVKDVIQIIQPLQFMILNKENERFF